MELIPDTNFLVYLAKYKLLDELKNYKIILVPQILAELKKLEQDKKIKVEDRRAATVALLFLESLNPKIEKAEGNTDDAILVIAKKLNAKIGTMDKWLSNKAKELGLKIVKIRQKKYLIDEY